MAEVYLARKLGPAGFEKRVVLKRILPDRRGESEYVKMFLDEARIAADLRHPNVVDVHEVGEDAGTWFIAMEFLHGEDLARLMSWAVLSRQPVPLGVCVRIIADAARGLDYAHRKKDTAGRAMGLVHRDVSPQNLIATYGGVTKVVDFGIARVENRESKTSAGMVKGKLRYMSPEQIWGEVVDARSDQLSLAIVLWELATLRRFYPQSSEREVMQAIANGMWTRPSEFHPDFPAALEGILVRALAVDVSRRYESCAGFADELEAFAEKEGISASQRRVANYLTWLFGESDETGSGSGAGSAESLRRAETIPSEGDARPPNPVLAKTDPSGPGPYPVEPSTSAVEPPAPVLTITDPRFAAAEAKHSRSIADALAASDEHALPDEQGSLVGRAEQLASLATALGEARVVTLAGPGGVGKSRLAIAHAKARRAEKRGGVWYVDLAAAKTVDDVCAEVGKLWSVPAAPSAEEAVTRVGRAVGSHGPALVVLDTAEHVVDAMTAVLPKWLALAPEARFLLASRERLRLAGERVIDVGPLPVPAAGATAAEVVASPAVALFIARAKEARPGWEPAETDLSSIAAISQELEGLPLSIELAASRISVLAPAKIQALLTSQRATQLLSSGARAGQDRRSTLKGALDWSWESLKPYEQQALAQASVFRGGFGLEAAEEVLQLPDGAPWILDVLQSLRDKSLLRIQELPSFGGEIRYDCFAMIRDHAAAALADDAALRAAEERHAKHYLRMGAEWASGTGLHGGLERRARLDLEMRNLLAIAERGLSGSRPENALAALEAMDPVALVRNPRMHAARLSAAIAAATAAPATVRGAALVRRARARRLSGDLAAAAADADAAMPLAESGRERALLADTLVERGKVRQFQGRLDDARADLQRALDLTNEAGDRAREAVAAEGLATVSHDPRLGDWPRLLYDRALRLAHELGDLRLEGLVQGNMALLLRRREEFGEAKRRYDLALALYKQVGDAASEANTIGSLAGLMLDEGKLDDADPLFAGALERVRRVGNRRSEGIFTGNRALLRHLCNDASAAVTGYETCLAILQEVGDTGSASIFRALLAMALAEQGDAEKARAALAAAEPALGGAVGACLAAVTRAFVDLVEAPSGTTRSRAMEAIAESERPGPPDPARPAGTPSIARQSEDVRFAVRLLRRRLP